MEKKSQFPVELAGKIIDMLHKATGDNAIFMDINGVIIAATQPERLGTVHEGGKRIMSGEMDELAISVESAQRLKGVLPGYNGVVFYKGERIGCIGLSGDPEKMRPLQRLAAVIVMEEYEKFLLSKTKRNIFEKVAGEIDEMSASIEQITAGSLESFNHLKEIEEMANGAEEYAENINNMLAAIKSIAGQTRLLGLNASIEAARAGENGKGFSVVASEIGRLSTNSAEALKSINNTMGEIKLSIANIAERIRVSTSIAHEQSDALQNISDSVSEIQKETEKLVDKE